MRMRELKRSRCEAEAQHALKRRKLEARVRSLKSASFPYASEMMVNPDESRETLLPRVDAELEKRQKATEELVQLKSTVAKQKAEHTKQQKTRTQVLEESKHLRKAVADFESKVKCLV